MTFVERRAPRVSGPFAPRSGVWDLATSETGLLVAGSLVALAAVFGFLSLAATFGPDLWVPVLVAMFLAAISVPMCLLASGRPLDRRLRKILLAAFALKMLCVFPRYLMNEVGYGGNSDAGGYHDAGATLRENMQQGEWTIEGSNLNSFPSETRFPGYVVGLFYLVTGASQMVAYLIFAWLSWIGLFAAFRAFQIGFPNAPPYRAAYLIFFLPSMLYWPSSIGKDALMVFAIGVFVLGVTRLLMGRNALLGGVLMAMSGLLMVQIRPHLLLIGMVGVATSLVARNADGASRGAVVTRGLLLVALVPALMLGLSRMDQMFGQTGGDPSKVQGFSVSSALSQTAGQTAIGGSAFEAKAIHSPVDVPLATISVLYRPFIFEVRNVPTLVSALESTLLLALTAFGARFLWRMGSTMLSHPVAAFCGGYTVAFVFAFSNIGNAGILARQRVQLFPVLVLLVAATAEFHRLNTEVTSADSDVSPTVASPPSYSDPRLVSIP